MARNCSDLQKQWTYVSIKVALGYIVVRTASRGNGVGDTTDCTAGETTGSLAFVEAYEPRMKDG